MAEPTRPLGMRELLGQMESLLYLRYVPVACYLTPGKGGQEEVPNSYESQPCMVHIVQID